MIFPRSIGKNEKTLAKNTFWLYVMQISSYVFPFFTFPYLTRILGPENYGVVVFANAAMAYFQMLLEFGFILSATNEISLNRDNILEVQRITFSVIWAKIFLAILGALILTICLLFVEKFRENSLFFVFSYIGTCLTVFLPDFLFRGIERMRILTYRVLVSKLAYTAFIFILIHKDQDYMFVPVATIASNVVAVVLTWIEIRKIFRENGNAQFFCRVKFKEIFSELKSSSVFFLSRIAVSMYQTLNTVLLGFRFSSAQLAKYGAANSLVSAGRSLISPISDSIYPYMVRNRNFRLAKKLILILEPVIVAGCVALYFIAPWFIRVFCGKGYEDAVPVFRAMLPLIVISLPTYLFGYPLMGALKIINIANYSVLIGSIFHVAGLFVLYFIEKLAFVPVALLTFATEIVVFSVRFGFGMEKLKEIKNDIASSVIRNYGEKIK